MKKLIVILMLIAASICNARTVTSVKNIDGSVLHTMQAGWVVVDETTAAGTEATALAKDERTKKLVDAAIAAASSGDDEISTFVIPASWNTVRFRACGTTDNGTATYQVYLGTLGGQDDCELVYAGQLAFVTGTQVSTYYQIAFTSGGPYIPNKGDIFTGNTSSETVVVESVSALTGGSWANGDAAGTITYRSKSGTFTSPETVKTGDGQGIRSNILTHAASDLVGFEMADTCTTTAKAWGSSWTTTSPADDDMSAEAEIDIKGADYLVVLASTASADCKLLAKGY